MKCPYCDYKTTKVVDTRESSDKVRRRRECCDCDRRFTTYETAEKLDIKVIKEDGDVKENFDEEKIRSGIQRASEKTGLTEEEADQIVEDVKKQVRKHEEIQSEEIGELVMEELKKHDEVAYIRFASVYQSFEDAESFQEEVESLQEVEEK